MRRNPISVMGPAALASDQLQQLSYNSNVRACGVKLFFGEVSSDQIRAMGGPAELFLKQALGAAPWPTRFMSANLQESCLQARCIFQNDDLMASRPLSLRVAPVSVRINHNRVNIVGSLWLELYGQF